MNRPGDILDAQLAEVFKRVGELIADLLVNRLREADAVWFGERLEARRDIDAIAINVLGLGDNVAEVDADPKPDALVVSYPNVPEVHAALYLDSAQHGFYDAGEFHQHAVAGVFDDAAVVLADFWIDQFAAVRLATFMRPLLIRTHHARIADHIGGKDCS